MRTTREEKLMISNIADPRGIKRQILNDYELESSSGKIKVNQVKTYLKRQDSGRRNDLEGHRVHISKDRQNNWFKFMLSPGKAQNNSLP